MDVYGHGCKMGFAAGVAVLADGEQGLVDKKGKRWTTLAAGGRSGKSRSATWVTHMVVWYARWTGMGDNGQ